MILETIGIHKDVPIEDYHSSQGISSSGISLILNCPKKYWYEYLSHDHDREKDTVAKRIGQAVHTATLEPDFYKNRFHVMPEMDRRTTAGKELYKNEMLEAKDKTILTIEEHEIVSNMSFNIRNHPMFKKITGVGNIEDSILWKDEESGALLRSRPDYYNDFLIVDLKTTEDASKESFSHSIVTYGYHRQGAMACDALSKMTGYEYSVVQFVVEKKPPYLVAVYLLDVDSLRLGRLQYKRGAKIYQECLEKDNWPGYEEKLIEIQLPRWAFKHEEMYV